MQPLSRSSRTPIKLSDLLDRSLSAYARTATAAGVGIMALAQASHAKIVYTPAHRKFTPFLKLFLDINHDGVNDFRFLGSAGHKGSQTFTQFLGVSGYASGDGIIGTNGQKPNQASALRAGARIGSSQLFDAAGLMAEHTEYIGKHSSSSHWIGQWVNGGKGVQNRYLGLRFKIKGKVHFGWARLTVKTIEGGFATTLTGYAYETIPNKSIIAGKTKGTNDQIGAEQVGPTSVAAPKTNTLGALALGAQGLPQWRQKGSASNTQ